jgi:hypothetical protein
MGETVFWLKSLYQLGFVCFFDFSHDEVINKVEIDKIEGMVNRKILAI